MSKVIYGSIRNKIVSSDLLEERKNKDFEGDLGVISFPDYIRQSKAVHAF